MSEGKKFNTISIDIVRDIIKSSVVVGKYRGLEVNEIIEENDALLDGESLLVLDIRKANPLDYVFCQFAFGSFLKRFEENTSNCKLILFLMEEHHKSCFFRGVLKYINKDLPRNKSFEAFVNSGMYTMIGNKKDSEIEFVSNLSNIDKEILDLVNTKMSITGRELVKSKAEYPVETITTSLINLSGKGFILHEKTTDFYYSIYNYLKN